MLTSILLLNELHVLQKFSTPKLNQKEAKILMVKPQAPYQQTSRDLSITDASSDNQQEYKHFYGKVFNFFPRTTFLKRTMRKPYIKDMNRKSMTAAGYRLSLVLYLTIFLPFSVSYQ